MAYLLTEDNIKHATLRFLKTYYKNNTSRGLGNTEASLDMQAGNGIIADGYIKFSVTPDPTDGLSEKEATAKMLEETEENKALPKKSFIATFEATSQRTAQEIQYRVQKTLLIFDAIAVASIVAATSYGYNYMNNQFTLNQLGTFLFFAGFFAVMLASGLAYAWLFRKLARYHHIHALAQFKRYHADEQWVAYGEDVFANPNNKYLIELKKQCIQQGFGLISVDDQLRPTLVITPSREEKKGASRKLLDFVASKTKGNKAFKWVDGIKIPTFKSPIDTKDYTQFTQSYWKQALVILAMLFLMGEIYLEELKNPNIVYVDEKEYQKKLEEKTKITETPPDYVLEEGDSITVYDVEGKRFSETRPATSKKQPKAKSTQRSRPQTNKRDALIISAGLEELLSYDCNRLAGIKGQHFLVQIATASNSTEAVRKVKAFSEDGFKANAVWLGCFLDKKIYVIYLDDIFNNKNAATERLERYQKLLIARNLNPNVAVLRAIEGK